MSKVRPIAAGVFASVLLLTSVVAETPASKSWPTDPTWIQVRYGGWGGPGVDPAPGPMDAILVRDYAPKSSLIVPVTEVAKAKFRVIDAHAHINARAPAEIDEWVKTMDEVGIQTSVVLTGATGAAFDELAELYLRRYPGRFVLFCGLLTTDVDAADYPARAVAELDRCRRNGARGVGELSDKGWGFELGVNKPRDRRLHPDDPRLDPFWDRCAALQLPVVIHIADHPSAWQPLDVYQERSPDYQHFNQFGKDVPSYEELLDMRDHAVTKHPRTRFIACHLGNQGNDLGTLSRVLDQHPNLYVDISARDYEVGRAPRAAVKFLTKYSDRVLFGTDMGREKSMYQSWWRLFETADEYMPGRVGWRYYGLALPDSVLERLYRTNALKLLPPVRS